MVGVSKDELSFSAGAGVPVRVEAPDAVILFRTGSL